MSSSSPAGFASLLTPPGRGAVAVIAAEGAAAHAAVDAHFRAANRLRLNSQRINRIVFGHWTDAEHTDVDEGREGGEEVILCRTSPSAVEIHCHGGVAAAERILAALSARGCQIASWPDWTARHAASPWEAEADEALARALTRRTASILLDQRHGALEHELAEIVALLVAGDVNQLAQARRRLTRLRESIPLGRRLTQPWQVAIAGRPNVGKSSLINALVGYQRAIVFDQPGTTRDVLAADTAIDGWPIRVTDSAGLRPTADPLEAAGVELARTRLERAELVVWVLDATSLTGADLQSPAEAAVREMAAELATPLPCAPLVVVNKADLVANPTPWNVSGSSAVATCALTGVGVQSLVAAIADRLVPNAPSPGQAIPFTARHAALVTGAIDQLDRGDVAGAASMLRPNCASS